MTTRADLAEKLRESKHGGLYTRLDAIAEALALLLDEPETGPRTNAG